MLSLYIHIPFCNHKCKYCSFFVMPENDGELKEWGVDRMKASYLEALLAENEARVNEYGDQQLRTIYLGGWTPFQLGKDHLWKLIDTLLDTWDCEFLEELSIELNPDPLDEVIEFIAQTQKRYKNVFRLRFSFGIQSLDDKILESSKRNYHFNNLIHRFREVIEIKSATTVYNLDFIAFGANPAHTQVQTEVDNGRLPRSQHKRDFFTKMMTSQAFDGVSVYTLELFPWAERYYEQKWPETQGAILSDDESIWKEFQRIKNAVMKAGYQRYEISNFALSWKRSLHNMVYWNMENYLGLWINASSCIVHDKGAHRFKNTTQRKQYLWGERKDEASLIKLWVKERKSEEVMLLLRTDKWIHLETYRDVLVENIDEIIADLIESRHLKFDEERWVITLSSKGMDVYNAVLMEVLEEI